MSIGQGRKKMGERRGVEGVVGFRFVDMERVDEKIPTPPW
jgi:hypothetical protein